VIQESSLNIFRSHKNITIKNKIIGVPSVLAQKKHKTDYQRSGLSNADMSPVVGIRS
jgi:hypothetical protein